ncbi:hypothetical protein LAJ19_00685 [Deinococcus taeanensis]|uniref:hypothetical protein n=1 Tax=Deinococcus taeanensis TaxID=2737050 RepID=UPI001CDC4BEA|nr:hypothetical protein [Deinococcus taeanensis]UBV42787.1 hypothetical protein LAJ19_00685 [Deinococcus taeanensis]
MNKTRLIALMAALAAGTASAAGTVAGTAIENTATASFQDPANTSSTLTSTSNKVTTTVLPLPGFDVVYSDGTADGNTISTTPIVTTGAVPGQKITTAYSVLNTGNIELTVNLTAATTNAAPGQTVQYFIDANGDGVADNTTALTSVTVPVDDPATSADEGVVRIVQVVTLPTDPAQITPTSVFGASPRGAVTGTAGSDPLAQPGNGYASGTTNNYENGKALDTDLQYVRITVFAPSLDNNPNTSPSTPVDSKGTPITNPALVPPSQTVQIPTEVTGKTGDADPTVPATGYLNPTVPTGDPTPTGTPIVANVATDNQIAYPKADANNLNDVVVFTNNLTNTSGTTDRVQLFPVLADGTVDTAYVYNATAGTFTNSATGVIIRFLDPVTGSPILVSSSPSDPTVAQYPTVTVPSGSTAVYRTEVTYPDPNDSDPIAAVVVKLGADSLKDAGIVSDSSTTNTIYAPAAQFGDETSLLGTSSATVVTQTVNPNGTFSGVSSPDLSDSTAVFRMDIVNNGQYNDSFTLSGSVILTVAATSATITVPVLYYAPDGSLLPRLSTDPQSPDYNKFITPVTAPGTEYKAYGLVDVPTGTRTGDYTVSQYAAGNYSTISMSDLNDVIRVSPNGNVAVAKFVFKSGVTADSNPVNGVNNPANFTSTGATGARPGDDIRYRIIGKNNYNTGISGFFLSDAVPANTTFKSIALLDSAGNAITSKVIYQVNSGGWSATAPTAGLASATVIKIALDNNSDLIPDILPASTTLTAEFIVTVK